MRTTVAAAVRGRASRWWERTPMGRELPNWSMDALPPSLRRRVRWIQVRQAVPPFRRPAFVRLPVAPGTEVWAHTDTFAVDVMTLDYVLGRQHFPAHLRDRVVLDVGAHKGYFAAVALVDGARAVVSYEPESTNHEAMGRARVAGRDADWSRRRRAVGAAAGEVDLQVSSESWSHSVHAPASGQVVRVERVPVTAFGDVVADAAQRHPDVPMVLKLNVEGAAGDCLLSVEPSVLAPFEELLVDLEANTPQALDDIHQHLATAGFAVVGERERVFHYVRRERETPGPSST